MQQHELKPTRSLSRSQSRIAAAAFVAVATVGAVVATRSPDHHAPTTTTTITVMDMGRDVAHAMMGTFATEKLKVTGTGSDSIVGSGGMQLAGSASFANGSTLYGVTITASTNHAGNALGLKAVDNTQDGASVRFLRSDGTIRWSLGNNTSVGSVTHDLYLFDNTNVNYALYLNPATTSFLRMGLSNGRLTYDDTTHGMTLSTNGTTRLTVADALITSAVALDMGTHLVNNVVDPVSAQDAATKNYVDTHSGFISGLTTNTIPKATSATSIGNSSSTDDGTTVAIGGAGKLEVNYSTNSVDWRGGFLSILSGGSLVIGNSGGTPVSNFLVDSTTGDVSTAGSITVPGGTVNLGTGAVVASAAGTVAATGAITADSGLRVFDVAGNGLTSSSNTVEVAAAIGGGITVNADSIQMTFCAANQIPQMNAGGTAWTCAAAASGTITGSGTVNTVAKFSAGTAVGNSSITDDGTTVAVNGNKLTVAVSTGNTLVAGTLDVTSNFNVNTNKFTVNGVSGDTTLAGGFTVATNRFAVNATTGNADVLGALTADSGLRVFDVAGAGLTSSTNTVDVVALAGGGLTANANSIQMTFCAANQVPTMNGAGTSWGCATPASGTIGGSITASGVVYASGANTAATDATAFQYYAAGDILNIGATAVTNCGAGACTGIALAVTSGTSGAIPTYSWNTSTSGYGGYAWNNSSSVQQGSMGFANSAVSLTNYRGFNFFSSPKVDFIFGEETTGTIINRIGMTAGSASSQWANGSSAAVSASGTGKFIYNNTTKTFRVSLDGGAFTSIVTGAVALNTIPKSANGTTGALTASSATDDGTTFAINTNKLTVTEASGNTNIAGTLDAVGAITENGSRVISAAGTGLSKSTNTLTVNIAGASCSAGQAVTAIGATGTGTCSAVGATESTTAPTLSSCGTGPTVSRANNITFSSTRIVSFTSVMGTGSPTSCTATFASAFSATPTCTVFYRNPGSPTSGLTLAISSVSSSAITYDSGGFAIETTFVHCIGPI